MRTIAAYLGCGKINKDFKATYLVVQRLPDIIKTVIPLFDKYQLEGSKVKDYIDFKRIADLMVKKAHLTKEGLNKIREIKDGMNKKKRRSIRKNKSFRFII